MSFYDTADFIEAFRNGGCFIFEGEEGNPDVTEEAPEDASLENTEGTDEEQSTEDTPTPDAPTNDKQPQDEESTEVSIPDDVKETSADTVNTDEPSQSKQSLDADQIAEEFKKSGALKQTIQYAMNAIKGRGQTVTESAGGKNGITLKMLLPYIKAGIEKFCQKHEFMTNVSEMAKAIMITLKSLDAKEVQKEKMKAAQAKKAAEQKEAAQQSQGDEGSAPEAGGEEAPAEEAPAPDEGGEEAPEQEEA